MTPGLHKWPPNSDPKASSPHSILHSSLAVSGVEVELELLDSSKLAATDVPSHGNRGTLALTWCFRLGGETSL